MGVRQGPGAFFRALDGALEARCEFRLALLGENFQMVLKPFLEARQRYGTRIVRYGYAETKEDHRGWLSRGDLVISTSIQENFGISIVEAVRFGCFPLLPRRLSYPELIPGHFHRPCPYTDERDLLAKLFRFLCNPGSFRKAREELSRSMERFSWQVVGREYDAVPEALAGP